MFDLQTADARIERASLYFETKNTFYRSYLPYKMLWSRFILILMLALVSARPSPELSLEEIEKGESLN